MTEQAPDRVWSGIDVSKTIAGALAAVCAAVIGSFLGVAGTLVGAAVASIIGSVGTEIWARSIRKGREKLQPAFIKVPAAVGTPDVAAATEDDSPSHTVPDGPKRQIHWKRVWLVAGVAFVLAMGSLTVFELISGKSLASAVGNSTGATSTVGGLLNPGSGGKTPAVTTSPTPTVAPTSDSGRTTTEAPATDAPTTPADTGSDQGATTGPTTPAATQAPAQSPPAAEQGIATPQ